MKILSNNGGIASTNCYLICDESTKQAVLFDAPDNTVDPLMVHAKAQGWDLIGLWLTHGHFDHIADHAVVTGSFPKAKVLLHELDALKMQNPRAQMFILPFTIPPRAPDQHINDGDKLKIGNLDVEVIHTPGHAPGHVMFHFPAQKILVGGDLIICGGVGRTDLPDSDEEQLFASIRRVMELPDDTQLLPGHCTPTTLGHERRNNPYVQEALAQ